MNKKIRQMNIIFLLEKSKRTGKYIPNNSYCLIPFLLNKILIPHEAFYKRLPFVILLY